MLKDFLNQTPIKENIGMEAEEVVNQPSVKDPMKSDAEYFEIVNPDTGLRYDIPLLSPASPDYYFKYVYYMKLKERSPSTFDKITSWN